MMVTIFHNKTTPLVLRTGIFQLQSNDNLWWGEFCNISVIIPVDSISRFPVTIAVLVVCLSLLA